jgi:hypothetical protein
VITERVRTAIEENCLTGVAFREVEMFQEKCLSKPTKPRKRRVWLPYDGPPIWELRIVSAPCHLNLKKSGWTITDECPQCHRRVLAVDESLPLEMSLFVDRRTWDGSDFLRTEELSIVLVTGKAANLLRKFRFTNLNVKRRGQIQ